MPKRLLASGWEKVLAKKDKMEQNKVVLQSVPKLTTFFPNSAMAAPTSTSSAELPDNVQSDAVFSSTTEAQPNNPDICSNISRIEDSSVHEASQQGINAIAHLRQPASLPTDPALWIPMTNELRDHLIMMGSTECQRQNSVKGFSKSKRFYPAQNQYRQLNASVFRRCLPNGDYVNRDWLIYSPSTGYVYCFYCRLAAYNPTQLFNGKGFNNWKKPSKFGDHENYICHRQAILDVSALQKAEGRIDSDLEKQLQEKRQYWRYLLERIAATVTFLCERGLAFRGTASNEKVGSPNNGNYLGILEVIAKFDPFLWQHIKENANKGSGHTSYLSKTICEELIGIMGRKVLATIIEEVNTARYFSVSVDSTPDISHVDQLTIILRYVDMSANQPIERFLGFIPIYSHTGKYLADTLLDFLSKCGINFANCRGQSYDNASNMSGRYSGMQQLLKNVNSLAVYVPCAAHSLNLVGHSAIDCCVDAVSFFGLLQQLYSFFAASTHRWKVLTDNLGEGCKVAKRLSDTRWSAHVDATNALVCGYKEIRTALESIADDILQKADARHEASTLINSLDHLESGIMCELWHDILQRFNACSKTLQLAAIELVPALGILNSLNVFLTNIREHFNDYEQKGMQRSGCDVYKTTDQRRRRRKRNIDDGEASEATDDMEPRDRFRIGTFNVVIDNLRTALSARVTAYSEIEKRFGFLANHKNLDDEEINQSAVALVKAYPTDLEPSFSDEFRQFVAWLSEQPRSSQSESHGRALWAYQTMRSAGVVSAFPNTEVAYRMYLCLMITNSSGERSFSQLKRIKNASRSTMGQERLSFLSLLSIECDLLRQIDFSTVLEEFASLKSRKIQL